MLHAFLVLAAETAEHAEPSKVPFYVAGGALALWAVVLSAVGIRSPAFPGSATGARGVMAISTVLVLAAMVSIIITA
ncbi:MAG: hypothetical protein QOG77_3579 [Solirubrobacteraceae bacterium]|jgi:hypothetical protein|nr:hypothetical protein [Solirubrobacteraceae bacterium]